MQKFRKSIYLIIRKAHEKYLNRLFSAFINIIRNNLKIISILNRFISILELRALGNRELKKKVSIDCFSDFF